MTLHLLSSSVNVLFLNSAPLSEHSCALDSVQQKYEITHLKYVRWAVLTEEIFDNTGDLLLRLVIHRTQTCVFGQVIDVQGLPEVAHFFWNLYNDRLGVIKILNYSDRSSPPTLGCSWARSAAYRPPANRSDHTVLDCYIVLKR